MYVYHAMSPRLLYRALQCHHCKCEQRTQTRVEGRLPSTVQERIVHVTASQRTALCGLRYPRTYGLIQSGEDEAI
ncbi:hypothetical protein KC19_VG288200 [Ceratodon purpureus]|uniref:Uncharacterized protein n=1 Tax=Ceratodon purpureus TaxID=3225 RepID=A0A8T0HV86_CERPU|nr:hypothetical protein KC19_VG288200 [Ceratodon purpureus]